MFRKSFSKQMWIGREYLAAGEFLESCWVDKILINIDRILINIDKILINIDRILIKY